MVVYKYAGICKYARMQVVRAHENNKKDFEHYKSELDWRAGYHESFTVLQCLVAIKTLSKGRSCVDADSSNLKLVRAVQVVIL